MLNNTLTQNLTSFGSIIIPISILLSSLAIIFNLILVIFLIHHGQFTKHSNKNNSRRIGLLHSVNTYIHLIGILSTLLIMCIRTLIGDLYEKEYSISWKCHFLAYLICLFAAGVYGSCFLQAIFRYWRVILPSLSLFQKLSFHIRLILSHWILIIILLLPVIPRSIYIPSDHFCFSPFDDRWTAVYISLITAIIPVIGIFILYIKIIIYMKHHLQTKRQWRRVKRDISVIRRILLLVIIILQTSSTGIILWILTFFNNRLHSIFYRLLRFSIIICMIICGITLLMVSPQLKRALRLNHRKYKSKSSVQKQNSSSNYIEETVPSIS
jgi:hypothetical protein